MSSTVQRARAVIVGGGPAGIATAACLRRRGLDPLVLEKGDTVAPAWRRHYERLHLHTTRGASGLPGRPMPADYPKYPSRDQVFDYLRRYALEEGVEIRFGVEVTRVRRRDGVWEIESAGGTRLTAPDVVIATGLSHVPRIPEIPNQEAFSGEILHSADYRNGRPYAGRSVLVIGFGNSAAEIALDLAEHGARSHVSVRSPTSVVPRDVLGIPVLTLSRFFSLFPPRLSDRLSSPLRRFTMGDVSKLGIPAPDSGPMEQLVTKRKVPVLDIGTVAALRRGEILAHPGVRAFTADGVEFTDGSTETLDAVVLGTGYEPGVDRFLEPGAGVLDDAGYPLVSGDATAEPGLYFCGFREAPSGRLRRIGVEAERLAERIAEG